LVRSSPSSASDSCSSASTRRTQAAPPG
jgi:hypothetical protein